MRFHSSKEKIYVIGTAVFAFLILLTIVLTGMYRLSVDRIPEYIEAGKYKKAVEAYNKSAVGNEATENEYAVIFENAIKDISSDWSTEEMNDEDAIHLPCIMSGLVIFLCRLCKVKGAVCEELSEIPPYLGYGCRYLLCYRLVMLRIYYRQVRSIPCLFPEYQAAPAVVYLYAESIDYSKNLCLCRDTG